MNAIFAAPALSENANRVIYAALRMDGVRLGGITQDPADKLRHPVAQHWRVGDVLDTEQLAWAVENVSARLGGAEVLFDAYEQLQVPFLQSDGVKAARLGHKSGAATSHPPIACGYARHGRTFPPPCGVA